MNPTIIDLLMNLVGNLNDEIEEQNECGIVFQFTLESSGSTHGIKWGEVLIWSTEEGFDGTIEHAEKLIRREAQEMIDFFKGLTMRKESEKFPPHDPNSESSSSESSSESSISSDSCDSSSSSNEKSSSSSSASIMTTEQAERRDFQERIRNANITDAGMINIGNGNIVHPTSPFGVSLLEKHPHIRGLMIQWIQTKGDE